MSTPLNSLFSELTPRLATQEDIVTVLGLLSRCIEEMRRNGVDQWDDVYPTRERFVMDLTSGSLYVGVEGQGIIGALTVNQQQDAEYAAASWSIPGERIAVVHRLMVDPEAQGRGVAQDLMGFAENLAAAQGCDVMRLDAFSSNPRALRLYRRLGYREAGEVRFRKGLFTCFEKRLGREGEAAV